MLSVPSSFPSMTPLPAVEILFEDGLPFEYTCPKCEQAIRAPVRTVCDHFYCRACINVQDGPTNCIVCQTVIPKDGVVADKEKHRQVQRLAVKCTFGDNGCQWKGELKALQGHLESCEFRDSSCSNCGKMVSKQSLQTHLAQCQAAVTQCSYCRMKIKTPAMERHLKTCRKVIISCPFQCGLIDVTREEMDVHRPKCPNVDNVCPFAEFGCTFVGDKVSVQQHLSEEPVRHLIYLCDETTFVKQGFAMLYGELSGVFDKSTELARRTYICEEMYGAQMVWRIDNVVTKMNEAKSGAHSTIFSPPFMSGRHGYKMVASASLFGDGQSRGHFMSAYVALVKGEFDSLQDWPFKMIVKLSLLDQNPRTDDRIDIVYTVDPRSLQDNAPFLSRPTSERNASFGAQSFCSLRKMEEYIKDDTMFIRVNVDLAPLHNLPKKTKNAMKSEQIDET